MYSSIDGNKEPFLYHRMFFVIPKVNLFRHIMNSDKWQIIKYPYENEIHVPIVEKNLCSMVGIDDKFGIDELKLEQLSMQPLQISMLVWLILKRIYLLMQLSGYVWRDSL
jgi:hypothetical protein